VVFAVGCRPVEDAVRLVIKLPAGEVLHPVVMSAEAGEIADIRCSAVLPGDRVVQVAGPGSPAAAGCAAGAVSEAHRPLEIGGHSVLTSADGEDCSGLRLDEDAGERGCVDRDTGRGLGIDRPIAVERGGCVGDAGQAECWDGDLHGGPDVLLHVDRMREHRVRSDIVRGDTGEG
jgi:hypothetical protein